MIDNLDSQKNYEHNKPDNYKSLSDYKDLLSVDNLAEIFGTTKGTIYKEIKNGKFGEPIKIGRKYIISKLFIENNFFRG